MSSITLFWSTSRYCFSNEETSPFRDRTIWQIRPKMNHIQPIVTIVWTCSSHVTVRIGTLKLNRHGSNAGSNCLDKSYLMQFCYWKELLPRGVHLLQSFLWSALNVCQRWWIGENWETDHVVNEKDLDPLKKTKEHSGKMMTAILKTEEGWNKKRTKLFFFKWKNF